VGEASGELEFPFSLTRSIIQREENDPRQAEMLILIRTSNLPG